VEFLSWRHETVRRYLLRGDFAQKYLTEIKLNGEVVGGKPTNNAISINSNGMDDAGKRLAAF